MNAQTEHFRSDSRVESLRLPPQSAEAEQAVLGGLMLAPDRLSDLADWLKEDDFYRRDHRLIYRAVLELAAKSKPLDVVTLGEWFEANALAEQVGGLSYLIELASNTPSAANIVAYAEIVVEKSRLRQLIEAGTEVVNAAFKPDGKTAGDVSAMAQMRLMNLAPAKKSAGPVCIKEALKIWHAELDRRFSEKVTPGLPTPWKDLNRVTQGLPDGEVTVLAGRSNMGKSVLGFQLAAFTALRKNRVLLFSMEQTLTAVLNRCVSALGEVPYQWLRDPNSDGDHWGKVTASYAQLHAAPLRIDESPRLSAMQIRARATREHLRQPVRMVVIDHLHEMALPGKQGEVIERADALRDLKAMAKELSCPVVVLAQLNRSATETDRPQLKHLRGSGGIEEVADLVLFAHRPDYYDPSDRPGLLELIIGKGRDVPTGETINLQNRFDIMRADDWQGDKPERKQAAPKTGWGRDRAAGKD